MKFSVSLKICNSLSFYHWNLYVSTRLALGQMHSIYSIQLSYTSFQSYDINSFKMGITNHTKSFKWYLMEQALANVWNEILIIYNLIWYLYYCHVYSKNIHWRGKRYTMTSMFYMIMVFIQWQLYKCINDIRWL